MFFCLYFKYLYNIWCWIQDKSFLPPGGIRIHFHFDGLAITKHKLGKVYWSMTMWGNSHIKCFRSLSLFLLLYSILQNTKTFVACCLIGLQYYGITNTHIEIYRTKCSKFYVQNSLANLDRGQNSTWLYEMKTFKFSWCPAYKFKRVHCDLKVHAAT